MGQFNNNNPFWSSVFLNVHYSQNYLHKTAVQSQQQVSISQLFLCKENVVLIRKVSSFSGVSLEGGYAVCALPTNTQYGGVNLDF